MKLDDLVAIRRSIRRSRQILLPTHEAAELITDLARRWARHATDFYSITTISAPFLITEFLANPTPMNLGPDRDYNFKTEGAGWKLIGTLLGRNVFVPKGTP